MQSLFPEYYHRDAEIKKAWESGLIVFDASVLLDLYRFSHASTQVFLDALEKHRDSVWLPYHFAWEYQRNRPKQITKQLEVYHILKDELKSCHQLLCDEKQRLPFLVQERVLGKIRTAIETLSSELAAAEEGEIDWYRNDPIREKFDAVFAGKIGAPYSLERSAEIRQEAILRYATDVPPGYKDKGKGNGNEDGDVFGWFQILDEAVRVHKPIIFVTSDEKVDWWEKGARARKIGPRLELRREMMERAGVELHMYTVNGFLRRVVEMSATPNDPGALQAIEEIEATSVVVDGIDDLMSSSSEVTEDLESAKLASSGPQESMHDPVTLSG